VEREESYRNPEERRNAPKNTYVGYFTSSARLGGLHHRHSWREAAQLAPAVSSWTIGDR